MCRKGNITYFVGFTSIFMYILLKNFMVNFSNFLTFSSCWVEISHKNYKKARRLVTLPSLSVIYHVPVPQKFDKFQYTEF